MRRALKVWNQRATMTTPNGPTIINNKKSILIFQIDSFWFRDEVRAYSGCRLKLQFTN